MSRTIAYLFAMLWGAIPALLVWLGLFPWRKRWLAAAGLMSPVCREVTLTLFWMFCGGMAVVTLTPRWMIWSLIDLVNHRIWNAGGYPFFELGTANLIPFRTFALDAHSLYILAGNIVMFVPFGGFAALLWRGYTWRRSIVTGLIITIIIECWQLIIGRTFDIDDLLLNSLGVFVGYCLWRVLRMVSPGLAGRFHVVEQSL